MDAARFRRLAFGPDANYLPSFDLYNAWFTAPADFDIGGWFLMYNAPGGLVATARPGRHSNEIKATLAFRAKPLMYDGLDRAAQQEELTRRFVDAGWESRRLLDAMRTASDFYFDSVGQVRVEQWSRGRVVLLGDAGYCPSLLTGLGTSLPLVGAYVLVGELVAAGGDHGIAFRRYQDRMQAYVAQAQQLPPGGVNGYAPTSAFMIRGRAASMRWMTRWPM